MDTVHISLKDEEVVCRRRRIPHYKYLFLYQLLNMFGLQLLYYICTNWIVCKLHRRYLIRYAGFDPVAVPFFAGTLFLVIVREIIH
jgi:hypothetical protein